MSDKPEILTDSATKIRVDEMWEQMKDIVTEQQFIQVFLKRHPNIKSMTLHNNVWSVEFKSKTQ